MTIQEVTKKIKEVCGDRYEELDCTAPPIVIQNGYVVEITLDSHKMSELTDSERNLAKNISRTYSKGYRIQWFL